ncbi:RHOMBOID-like protein 2 [Camellia lanceoleosa]|uniref:RHOMBOID-like protein 2 n=1 Tax=Camellia lanceoleosa TaxID=1840588 RepID=A0ACC0GIB5_9ERIC|nr:RHOMBOID-like protein 2 [Camellia lanceoleosa]
MLIFGGDIDLQRLSKSRRRRYGHHTESPFKVQRTEAIQNPPSYYLPLYYLDSTETMWPSWFIPMIVVANIGMFIAIMFVNDCSKNNLSFEGGCVAKFADRFLSNL